VRKITSQEQLGATIRHEDSAARQWEGRVYAGQRENLQYQSIFNTDTRAWNNSWVGLDRDYYGLGLSGSQNLTFSDVTYRLTGGFEADYSEERRQGGAATGGEKVAGSLTRNEDNVAQSVNAYLLGTFFFSERYTFTAGARVGEVEFESKDLYVTSMNADGSGKVRYSQVSPVVGVTRHVDPSLNVFANYGRGFETPTLAEVAYASSSSGTTPTSTFNRTIRSSKNDQAELGVKWRPGSGQSLTATVFWVSTENEIVTDQNAFGRTSFKNAPKTKRAGAELSWSREWSEQWRSLFTATMIDATYETAFSTNAGPVAAGKKIPGIPAHVAFAEIEWAQARSKRSQPQGFSAAVEAQSFGKRYSDDANTPSRTADAFETVALRTGYSRTVGATDLRVFARIDNLLDEKYVGSVIVNNASPFEPSPERNWMIGVKAVTRF
jgi:iron complex outermembrane receptor protein